MLKYISKDIDETPLTIQGIVYAKGMQNEAVPITLQCKNIGVLESIATGKIEGLSISSNDGIEFSNTQIFL